jgi:hypothetical protein
MKAPSAVDIAIVMSVVAGVQAAFATIPEAAVWWAPAVSAGLLAVLKVAQVMLFPEGRRPVDPAAPGAAAQASAESTSVPSKRRQFFVD